MKYKFYAFIFFSVLSLFAFKAEVTTTPRKVLLGQLDSLELEIQQRRRAGKPIEKIEEEIARLKWTIEESKSDTAQISDSVLARLSAADIEPSEPVVDTKKTKKSGFDRFLKEHSTLDLMIIVVGAVAALAIVLLILFLIYVKLFKGAPRMKKGGVKVSPKAQSKKPLPKTKKVAGQARELTAQEKRDTLEDIKSKLSALNDRHTKERLQQRVKPVEPSVPSERSHHPEMDFENPFQVSDAGREAGATENPFEAASSLADLSHRPILGQPGEEPDLLPEQSRLEETLEEQRRETLEIPAEQASNPRPLSLNERIVDSFDRGDDLVTIAQTMNMSIDQIKMILRISGR